MTKKALGYISILIVSFLFVFCQQNSNQPTLSDKKPVSWSKNLSIYEVNIRQYTKEGTFNAFSEHLPRLKELGVGILWIMPINPIGEKNRKGPLGSYYSISDYTAINPLFGNKEDYKNLVDEIHKLGMYVIVDWVANHTAWDNPWTETHPEFYKKDSTGNFIPPVADWTDVIALDYDNQGLRTEMLKAMKYWVQEFNIDGYRCDVAGMVPVDFWNEARKELDEIKPVFMLAEAEEVDLHEKAFDMSYAWSLHHSFNEVAQGKENADDLYNVFEKRRKEFGNSAYRMNFTSNHDENTWNGTVHERLGDAFDVMTVLTYTLDGMPLIYSGQEAGLNKRLEFFEKDPIEWKESKNFDFYKKLNKLKRDNLALWNGDYGSSLKRIMTDDNSDILAFYRVKDSDEVVTITNLSNKPVKFTFTSDIPEGSFTDYFSGEIVTIGMNTELSLGSWDYKVLVNK